MSFSPYRDGDAQGTEDKLMKPFCSSDCVSTSTFPVAASSKKYALLPFHIPLFLPHVFIYLVKDRLAVYAVSDVPVQQHIQLGCILWRLPVKKADVIF